ncbi:MAG: hypothetical protein ACJ762_06205 [Solirubrobacteraceae bacterium]
MTGEDPLRPLLSLNARRLIVAAGEQLLSAIRGDGRDPAAVADGLVIAGVLPACYRSRYDQLFLTWFHNVVELARNSLVGDLPFLATTAEQLAGRALLAQARAQAADEPDLYQLIAELDGLEDIVLEDTDADLLFDVDDAADLLARPGVLARPELRLIRFEHWLIPFGDPPTPALEDPNM